jgi:hypothetical protein
MFNNSKLLHLHGFYVPFRSDLFVYFTLHILYDLFLKDLRSMFGPEQQRYLESQLQKYRRVVGPVLSERMVYSLG